MKIYREKSNIIPKKYPLVPNCGSNGEENGGTVAVFYNDEEITFVFECQYELPLEMPYSRYNDPVWRGEAVEIFISPYADKEHYFEFDTAPNGACYNAQILNLGDSDVFVRSINKSPVRYIASIEETSYVLEIHIPFSLVLKAGDAYNDVPWIFNAYRIHDKKHYAFSPTGEAGFHVPERFDRIYFG